MSSVYTYDHRLFQWLVASGRRVISAQQHHTIIQLEDTALRALVYVRAARNTLHNEACVLQQLRQATD